MLSASFTVRVSGVFVDQRSFASTHLALFKLIRGCRLDLSGQRDCSGCHRC